MLKWVLLATVLACGVVAGPLHAASFDCKKAKTPIEHVICSDPEATKFDAALNTAYRSAMDQLSPEGQASLRRSELSFLSALSIQCRPRAIPAAPGRPSQPSEVNGWCVEGAFRDRAALLSRSVGVFGGRRYFTVSNYRARIAQIDKGDGTTDPFDVTQEVDIVQIDAPHGDAEFAWNAAMLRQAAAALKEIYEFSDDTPNEHDFDTNDYQQVRVTMSLVGASPDLISTVLQEDAYHYGAAHPREWSNAATTWSFRLGRPIMANDIFDATKPWRRALQAMVEAHLKPFNPPIGSVKPYDVDRPSRWQLRADGLYVVYIQYELGSYLSAADASIPWSELTPYLQQDVPFDPAEIQSVGEVIY